VQFHLQFSPNLCIAMKLHIILHGYGYHDVTDMWHIHIPTRLLYLSPVTFLPSLCIIHLQCTSILLLVFRPSAGTIPAPSANVFRAGAKHNCGPMVERKSSSDVVLQCHRLSEPRWVELDAKCKFFSSVSALSLLTILL
jgi:hypothetical protein